MLGSPAGVGAGNGSARGGGGSSLSRTDRSALVRGANGQRVLSISARSSAARAAFSVSSSSRLVIGQHYATPGRLWLNDFNREPQVMRPWSASAARPRIAVKAAFGIGDAPSREPEGAKPSLHLQEKADHSVSIPRRLSRCTRLRRCPRRCGGPGCFLNSERETMVAASF